MLQAVYMLALGFCSMSTACRQPANTTTEPLPTPGGIDRPLNSFNQILTSTMTSMSLRPGQETKVPVRIENPGSETWVSSGGMPVTISYKWFKGAQMLPIEGERTILPVPVRPNQALNVDVRVVAPNETGDFTVRISLVQESVAWFMTKSSTFLQIPALVR
jgi:hypothetical protein